MRCHNPLPVMPSYAAAVGVPAAVPAQAVPLSATNRGFYRSPLRTFVFALIASNAYLIWWTFQLLAFAQRERFRNSGPPWWILFPIVNLVYIGRAFRGISEAEKAALGNASLNVAAVSAGYILAVALGRLSGNVYGAAGFAMDLGVGLIIAAVLATVQRSANRYQAAVHPDLGPAPAGMAGRYTWGEIVALILGCILTLAVFVADLSPS
jgi:hypothetical protein